MAKSSAVVTIGMEYVGDLTVESMLDQLASRTDLKPAIDAVFSAGMSFRLEELPIKVPAKRRRRKSVRVYQPVLPDQLLMERIRSGTIVVDWDRMAAVSTIASAGSSIVHKPSDLYVGREGRTTKYPCVWVHWRRMRRKVFLHRLAWMIYHESLIPDGHDVHHEDRNVENWHHSNLKLLDYDGHYDEHYGVEEEPYFT